MLKYSNDGVKIGTLTISLPEVQYLLEHKGILSDAKKMLIKHQSVTIISYMPDIVWDEEDDMSSVQEVITITIDNYNITKFIEALPELHRWVYDSSY